ncbi:MAG: hypothetical protein KAH23_06215 [Kiritimatiellae bacterium]|nr:hypothetical protein [Kiritimatiellia bacterium]
MDSFTTEPFEIDTEETSLGLDGLDFIQEENFSDDGYENESEEYALELDHL